MNSYSNTNTNKSSSRRNNQTQKKSQQPSNKQNNKLELQKQKEKESIQNKKIISKLQTKGFESLSLDEIAATINNSEFENEYKLITKKPYPFKAKAHDRLNYAHYSLKWGTNKLLPSRMTQSANASVIVYFNILSTGDVSKVKEFFRINAKYHDELISCFDSSKKTPLHISAKNGHYDLTEFLLNKGVSVYSRDKFLRTPLHWAALNNHETVVELLIKKGSDLKARDNNGRNALHFSMSSNSSKMVTYILSSCKELINMRDAFGRTALHYLIWNDCDQIGVIFSLLIKNGVEVSAVDFDGLTALHYAAEAGKGKLIPGLIESGCYCNLKEARTGRTALELAYNDVIRQLILAYSGDKYTVGSEDKKRLVIEGVKVDEEFVQNEDNIIGNSAVNQNTSNRNTNIRGRSRVSQNKSNNSNKNNNILIEDENRNSNELDNNHNDQLLLEQRKKLVSLLKGVQEYGIKSLKHISNPDVYTGSWVENVKNIEDLKNQIDNMPVNEAILSIFNILNPLDAEESKKVAEELGMKNEKEMKDYLSFFNSTNNGQENKGGNAGYGALSDSNNNQFFSYSNYNPNSNNGNSPNNYDNNHFNNHNKVESNQNYNPYHQTYNDGHNNSNYNHPFSQSGNQSSINNSQSAVIYDKNNDNLNTFIYNNQRVDNLGQVNQRYMSVGSNQNNNSSNNPHTNLNYNTNNNTGSQFVNTDSNYNTNNIKFNSTNQNSVNDNNYNTNPNFYFSSANNFNHNNNNNTNADTFPVINYNNNNSNLNYEQATSQPDNINTNNKFNNINNDFSQNNTKTQAQPLNIAEEINKQFNMFVRSIQANPDLANTINEVSLKKKEEIDKENRHLQEESKNLEKRINELKEKIIDYQSIIHTTKIKENDNNNKINSLNNKIELLNKNLLSMKKEAILDTKIPLSTFLTNIDININNSNIKNINNKSSNNPITSDYSFPNNTNMLNSSINKIHLEKEKAIYLFLNLINKHSFSLEELLHKYDSNSDMHLLKQEFSKLLEDLNLPLSCRSLIYEFTSFTKTNKLSITKILKIFQQRKENKENLINALLFKLSFKLIQKKFDTKLKIVEALFPELNVKNYINYSKNNDNDEDYFSSKLVETRIGLSEMISIMSVFDSVVSKFELEELFKCYEISEDGKIDVGVLVSDVFKRIELINEIGWENVNTKVGLSSRSNNNSKNYNDAEENDLNQSNKGYSETNGVFVNSNNKYISNRNNEDSGRSKDKRSSDLNYNNNAYEYYDSKRATKINNDEINNQIEDYVEDNIVEEEDESNNNKNQEENYDEYFNKETNIDSILKQPAMKKISEVDRDLEETINSNVNNNNKNLNTKNTLNTFNTNKSQMSFKNNDDNNNINNSLEETLKEEENEDDNEDKEDEEEGNEENNNNDNEEDENNYNEFDEMNDNKEEDTEMSNSKHNKDYDDEENIINNNKENKMINDNSKSNSIPKTYNKQTSLFSNKQPVKGELKVQVKSIDQIIYPKILKPPHKLFLNLNLKTFNNSSNTNNNTNNNNNSDNTSNNTIQTEEESIGLNSKTISTDTCRVIFNWAARIPILNKTLQDIGALLNLSLNAEYKNNNALIGETFVNWTSTIKKENHNKFVIDDKVYLMNKAKSRVGTIEVMVKFIPAGTKDSFYDENCNLIK